MEEEVLRLVRADPMTSIRLLSIRLNVPRITIWRILKKEGLHPYHFRRAQHLEDVDYRARSVFCSWILSQQRTNPEFLKKILWTDRVHSQGRVLQTTEIFMSGPLKTHTSEEKHLFRKNFLLMYGLE
ncbi:unnamed protein product [Parnassius apollo]|uniref:(apollo) hypothetical protein n=1 Tax=Parnassius apollo TaxID=110799 RepID=A0A8S3XFG3_PARAO|nr:unnamed protein product [Parnassius apollo]